MRASILRRRGGRLVDGLRIYRRQASPAPAAPPPEVESDDESDDDLDGPDTPSPTETTFLSSISPSDASAPAIGTSAPTTQPTSVDLGNIGTETLEPISTSFPSTETTSGTPVFLASSQAAETQNDQTQHPDYNQITEEPTLMTRGGVIAMGTIIGLATLVTVVFIVWKCRCSRNRSNADKSSKFKPFWLGKDGPRQQPGVRAPAPSVRNQTRMMDDLMVAAYAAENGNPSVYGGGGARPASQQSSDSLWREKQQALHGAYAPQPQRKKSAAGSLYASQLRTGFWKNGGDDLPTVPGQARVPAPAPSVAGRTEMTSQSGATESTWNTWGVMQHHDKPRGNLFDKLRR